MRRAGPEQRRGNPGVWVIAEEGEMNGRPSEVARLMPGLPLWHHRHRDGIDRRAHLGNSENSVSSPLNFFLLSLDIF